jgi:hypothetical protein
MILLPKKAICSGLMAHSEKDMRYELRTRHTLFFNNQSLFMSTELFPDGGKNGIKWFTWYHALTFVEGGNGTGKN